MEKGCGSAAGHGAKVENHAIDGAIQQAFAPRVFPDLLKLYPNVASWKNQAEMVYQNWMHGHSLDESAINYDGISIVRLIAFLRLGASDNPSIASMPDGPADLKSDKFKAFLKEFADALTPAGYLSNHGGGLQNDAQGYGNGGHLFTFFFEQGATSFMQSDPEAAQYFKWAAREMWRNTGGEWGPSFPTLAALQAASLAGLRLHTDCACLHCSARRLRELLLDAGAHVRGGAQAAEGRRLP